MHIHNQNIIHNDIHYYSNPLLLQNAAVNELYDPCFLEYKGQINGKRAFAFVLLDLRRI